MVVYTRILAFVFYRYSTFVCLLGSGNFVSLIRRQLLCYLSHKTPVFYACDKFKYEYFRLWRLVSNWTKFSKISTRHLLTKFNVRSIVGTLARLVLKPFFHYQSVCLHWTGKLLTMIQIWSRRISADSILCITMNCYFIGHFANCSSWVLVIGMQRKCLTNKLASFDCLSVADEPFQRLAVRVFGWEFCCFDNWRQRADYNEGLVALTIWNRLLQIVPDTFLII